MSQRDCFLINPKRIHGKNYLPPGPEVPRAVPFVCKKTGTNQCDLILYEKTYKRFYKELLNVYQIILFDISYCSVIFGGLKVGGKHLMALTTSEANLAKTYLEMGEYKTNQTPPRGFGGN